VALREPLSREARGRLERLLSRRGVKVERYLFAPLSDIAFAVRWAWTPDAFVKERATLATMVRLGLLTAAVEMAVLRSLRSRCVCIGDRLVQAGAIDHTTLQAALETFWTGGLRLGDHLVACGAVEAVAVDAALAAQEREAFDVVAVVSRLGLLGEEEALRLRREMEAEGLDA
jgi:hypothetical protein